MTVDREDAPFVALLAAIETLARTNRALPIRCAAGTLWSWPPQARRWPAEDARRCLLPLLEVGAAPPAEPYLSLSVTFADVPAPASATGAPGAPDGTLREPTGAVRLRAHLTAQGPRVELRCAEGDPWRRTAGAVGEIFAELLRELLAEPARRPADAAGISPASRRAVLGPLAGRAHDDGPFRAVAHLIEDRVDRHPERPAYTFGGRTLSYRRFDQLANGLAAELAARGAGPGDVVPVLLVNGLEMPVAYQALMKLGAAFVPLDPGWPPERIATTLAVLDPQTVVCRDAAALPQPYRARALAVDVDRLAGRAERPAVALRPDGVVYGIFTSGTTGRPKCALNVQAGLANRFLFMTRYFGATGDEVVLQNSKHTFDSSVWQLFWPLTTGARTVIPAQGEFLDLDHTIETIAAHGITMTDFVPSIFNMMVSIVERDPAALRKVASLRQLIVGGEEMNRQAVAALQALLPVRVTNGYGPTETSIGMVFHTVAPDDGDTIPLGRPIDNCYAVIVDDERHPLPQGAVGEIAIGGVCLGRGYFGDPQRTAELFVANPFAEIPGPRLYRTGDLGYFDQRGLLYFLGRTDFQVKIGGVRIELGELEVAAESCPHVRTAKVLVAQRGADKTLAVFAAGDDELSENALRAHLRAVLPRTSLPRHYFVLAELPLTDNGKVDRRALQALLDRALAEQAGAIEADGSATLALDRVLRTFRAVLHSPALSADESFLDAGGESIQALAAVQRLAAAFGVPLGAQELFDHPSAGAMCRLIERKLSVPAVAAEADAVAMERDARAPVDLVLRCAPRDGPLETVLVTGATGFVGSRIVYELLAGTRLRVVCPCRAHDDGEALRRVVEALRERGLWRAAFAGRLSALAADLARERLALSAAAWDGLARRCDLIVHNGALVNFLFDYRDHRGPNVLGTYEMLRLAMAVRPKPLHYVSTLGVLDSEAVRRSEPLPESFDPARAIAPSSGYSRSKWVAERALLDARRKGALVTVLRLGEVMPSAEGGWPNPHALTHFLLAAFQRLGVAPDVPLRSDYTPVDHVAARVAAAVADRAAWGSTLHLFHSRSVDFGALLAGAGTPTERVACGEFLARLERAVAQRPDHDLTVLRALLPAAGGDAAALRAAFGGLLSDNPRLFRKDACRRFEQRWGLGEEPLEAAVRAYREYLVRHAGPAAAPGYAPVTMATASSCER